MRTETGSQKSATTSAFRGGGRRGVGAARAGRRPDAGDCIYDGRGGAVPEGEVPLASCRPGESAAAASKRLIEVAGAQFVWDRRTAVASLRATACSPRESPFARAPTSSSCRRPRTATIFRGTLGKARTKVFLSPGEDGRVAANGLSATRDRLVVAGSVSGLIFVYDIRSGKLVRRFATGTGGLINDVTVTPGGDAYATDSKRGLLFRIPAKALSKRSSATRRLRPFVRFAQHPGRARTRTGSCPPAGATCSSSACRRACSAASTSRPGGCGRSRASPSRRATGSPATVARSTRSTRAAG